MSARAGDARYRADAPAPAGPASVGSREAPARPSRPGPGRRPAGPSASASRQEPVDDEGRARIALGALGWNGAACLVVARGFTARLRGMIGREGEYGRLVMAFPGCRSVHTHLMRAPLDIAFIGYAGEVLVLHTHVPPGRLLACPRAELVLERFSP